MRKKYFSQKGQLLLEALVAMALVGIIITGIVTSLVYSINNANIARDQNIATSYAQQGLDIARNLKDSDFTSFSTLPTGNYYLNDGDTTLVNGRTPIPIKAKYTRKIYINQSGQDQLGTQKCTNTPSVFTDAIVTWSDTRCRGTGDCHKVELNSCFTDPSKILY